MAIKAVFLDLDNTLLPIDEKAFYKLYFGGMGQYFAPLGIEAETLLLAVMKGTEAMRANSSNQTNQDVFWSTFNTYLPGKHHVFKQHIEPFYQQYFPSVQSASHIDPRARILIEKLQQKHKRLFLATNPLFPSMATHQRVAWAGLTLSMFEKITTMENAYACKPNPRYFQLLLDEFSLNPHETIMIGNDWVEDTAAERVGIRTIILSDYAMKEKPKDVSSQSMSFDELIVQLDEILQ
jgi:FMN phosphatase YigB (HAD superfamily)